LYKPQQEVVKPQQEVDKPQQEVDKPQQEADKPKPIPRQKPTTQKKPIVPTKPSIRKNSKEVLSYLLMYQAGKENSHCVYIWVCMSILSLFCLIFD
jgi:hypothetical protein